MVYTAPWLRYPNKNVFSDRRTRHYIAKCSEVCCGVLGLWTNVGTCEPPLWTDSAI